MRFLIAHEAAILMEKRRIGIRHTRSHPRKFCANYLSGCTKYLKLFAEYISALTKTIFPVT